MINERIMDFAETKILEIIFVGKLKFKFIKSHYGMAMKKFIMG